MWPLGVVKAALAGMALVAAALAYEVFLWRSARRFLTRRHKLVRLAAGIILIGILGMIYWGGLTDFSINPLELLAYWGACTVLILLLVVLAILDIRESLIAYVTGYTAIARGMLEEKKRNQHTT